LKKIAVIFAALFFSATTSATAIGQIPPTSMPGLAAKVDTTPGYLLVMGRTLDRAKIIQYSTSLPSIYAASGGRYIGIGRPGAGVSCVYGLCEGRSAVVATWADDKNIEAFWWGDAYRQAVRLRDKAGVFTVVGLKGLATGVPYQNGALLIVLINSKPELTATVPWLAAASSAGAALLVSPTTLTVSPLEGDALFQRTALLSFTSKAERDSFAAGEATQTFIKNAAASSQTAQTTANAILAIVAIDAPPTSVPAAVLPLPVATPVAK